MWKKICITLCAVFCAALAVVPCAFADDSSADSSASSVDSLADTLKSTPGELHYNVKDQFPKFIKQSIEWVPLPYWWAFEFAIVLGFVNALYRRMS